ncbi:hypothetical protein D3C84_711400 [compost metagenome]
MAVKHAQPYRTFVAEGDRQGVLQVGTPGHRRVAITLGQLGEQAAHRLDVALDNCQRRTDLQDHGGVHDVLGSGTPVHVASGLATGFRQLFHQRQNRVTDDFGLVLHQRQVEGCVGGEFGNLLGSVRRNHPTPCFGASQCHFYFDVAFDQGFVRKHAAHLGGAEHVAKEGGVEDGAGHELILICLLLIGHI